MLLFFEIIPKLISQERGLIDIGRLKYENPNKDNKPPIYQNNEAKEVHVVEESQLKERPRREAK